MFSVTLSVTRGMWPAVPRLEQKRVCAVTLRPANTARQRFLPGILPGGVRTFLSKLLTGVALPTPWDQRTWSDDLTPKPRIEDRRQPSSQRNAEEISMHLPTSGLRDPTSGLWLLVSGLWLPASLYQKSKYTMRPHWSHVASLSPLRDSDSASLETFRWQPPHLPSRIGTHAGNPRVAIRS